MPYPQAVLDIAARINNWGRWGEDDQIGTLNFLTDEVVKEAAQCIRTGKRISLAYPLHKDGLQTGVTSSIPLTLLALREKRTLA